MAPKWLLCQVTPLNGHLILSGVCLRVDLRTNKKKMCSKEIGLHAQCLLIILSSLLNIIGGTYMII